MSSDDSSNQTNVAAEELRSFVERVERLEEDKKEIAADIKDVYGEAKNRGYDTRVLRRIVSLRKQDPAERAELQAIEELYMSALGMGIQERLTFPDESPRTVRQATTVQLCDGDGKPLHAPVSAETMKAAVDVVKGKAPKPKVRKLASTEADERLRDERAKGAVFA